jgi:hypothetical protein
MRIDLEPQTPETLTRECSFCQFTLHTRDSTFALSCRLLAASGGKMLRSDQHGSSADHLARKHACSARQKESKSLRRPISQGVRLHPRHTGGDAGY